MRETDITIASAMENEGKKRSADKNQRKKRHHGGDSSEERDDSPMDSRNRSIRIPSEEDVQETVRREIRTRNLTQYTMVRTEKRGLRYEADLSIQEKKYLEEDQKRYSGTHVGLKIVDAVLDPSARSGSSENNKAKILRYVYGRGYKVNEAKSRGFARLELLFANHIDANRILDDKHSVNIAFRIPSRAKTCIGMINGWDLDAPLDELISVMVYLKDVLKVERLKRRLFNRETKTHEEQVSHVICMTCENSKVLSEIRRYGGLSGLKVRPFVENVLQCYRCYKFGHLAKHCKSGPMCVACGDAFHGRCDKQWRCINCGGRHWPTDRNCEV